MGTHQSIRKTVAPEIPDKLYFRIGDVARLCEVPAYVLRFWETEFPQLKPNKGGTGQRLYRKRDVEMALRIKSLLYDQGYTIPGARQFLKAETKPKEAVAFVPAPEAASQPQPLEMPAAHPTVSTLRQLNALRDEMRGLLATLSKPVATTPSTGEGKVKPMRPRLMLEPKPALTAVVAKPQHGFTLHQGDLFSVEAAEPSE